MSRVPKNQYCVEDNLTISQAVERLQRAILLKESHYDTPTKRELHLLLDANDVPASLSNAVQDRIMTARSTDFAAIWLVGPSPTVICQLA